MISHLGRLSPAVFAACISMVAAGLPAAADDKVNGQVQVQVIDPLGLVQGDDEEEEADAGAAAPNEDEEKGQVLHFSDGNTLHGTLGEIRSAEQDLTWLRPDVTTPLQFALGSVKSLTFGEPVVPETSDPQVTVKFSGGDWLTAGIAEVTEGSLKLAMPEGLPLSVERGQVEWIYFPQHGPAPECYDGPTSLSGWVSDGSWEFKEGALRATRPAPIGRPFEALPDQVEYFFELDQHGEFQAFSITLRSPQVPSRGFGPGRIQLMFSGTELRLFAQVAEEMKNEQVDLRQILGRAGDPDSYQPPGNRPVQYRILEDFPGGRLIVFIDGRKVADWAVNKGEAGKHHGGFTFQPVMWTAATGQSLNRVRVLPWDGRVPSDGIGAAEWSDEDVVSLANGEVKAGRWTGISDAALTFRTPSGDVEVPRDNVTLLRLRKAGEPPDEDPPLARVRLARRGEFDVQSLEIRGGKLTARTAFSGSLSLTPSSVRRLDFCRMQRAGEDTGDTLVFKNGDRLPGHLEAAGTGRAILWRAQGSRAAAEIALGRAAGVLLASRLDGPTPKRGAIARFRNGDWLSGDFLKLDGDGLSLDTAHAGQLKIPRRLLRALYFASGGLLPWIDGAAGSDSWMNAADFRRAAAAAQNRRPADAQNNPANPWTYFDGAFTLARPGDATNPYQRVNPTLGRIFDGMPQSVEVSFDISVPKTPLFIAAQLFSEPNNPGYMMQSSEDGMFIFEMSPRQRGRGAAQQQIPFEGKIKKDATRHQYRFLADRPSGKLVILVDGVVVAQLPRKAGEGARDLGRGFLLMPQTTLKCTVSNLSIGPWNGRIPGQEPAADVPSDTVLLANGDEVNGKIDSGTQEAFSITSEVGPLTLPTPRVTTLDFGDDMVEAHGAARLRFGDAGVISVRSFSIENDEITCDSLVGGELKIPLAALREVIVSFTPPANPAKPPR